MKEPITLTPNEAAIAAALFAIASGLLRAAQLGQDVNLTDGVTLFVKLDSALPGASDSLMDKFEPEIVLSGYEDILRAPIQIVSKENKN